MHCQRCGYLLLNLTRSDCPECGEAYDVRQYRFAPGSVTFHCPHCDQPYYGNDPQGLPYPQDFRCTTCGEQVSLPQMRVVPLTPDAVGWAGSYWDNRERLGLWTAWWKTLGALLMYPSRFFRNHRGRSLKEAWLFSTLSLYAGMVPAMFFQFLIFVALGMFVAAAGAGAAAAPGPGGGFAGGFVLPFPWWVGLVFTIFLALLIPPFMQFAVGGFITVTIHTALAVLAPQRKSMGDTYRTVLYSYGVYALNAIPICGQQAAGIWLMVTLINGIKEVHHTSGGRATIAVLWPVAAMLGCYLLIVMGMVFAFTR